MIQMTSLLKEVEMKILEYYKQKGWSWNWGNEDRLNVSDIVDGINLAESLQLMKLYETLLEMLYKQVIKTRDSNEENNKEKKDFLKELQTIDEKLADRFQEKMDKDEKIRSTSKTFLNVFKDLKSKSFIENLNNETGKLKENEL